MTLWTPEINSGRCKGHLFYDAVSAAVEDVTEWLSAINSEFYGLLWTILRQIHSYEHITVSCLLLCMSV
jgi:hypothetical protein